ncbi:MAG: hypothetical protein LAT82_06015 [Nanoarchaeota archaeon]|nr:hypothetical protein [Nanoarchaeota archaeon]
MVTQMTLTSTKKNIENVDWELVNDFKQGLEELKQGKVEEFRKGSLLE